MPLKFLFFVDYCFLFIYRITTFINIFLLIQHSAYFLNIFLVSLYLNIICETFLSFYNKNSLNKLKKKIKPKSKLKCLRKKQFNLFIEK